MPHEDPFVITLKIADCLAKMVLVDEGSTVEIMLYSTFADEEIIPVMTALVKFEGHLWFQWEPSSWR